MVGSDRKPSSPPTMRRVLLVVCCCVGVCAPLNVVAAEPSGNRLAPKAFRAAAKRVLPSLVAIESFGGIASSGDSRVQGINRLGDGPTTGLIVSPDGYVITSTFSFIEKPPVITLILSDGQRHVAKLLGRDETRKICLLKIDGVKNLPTASVAPLSDLKVGQWAISVGVGFGKWKPAISAGIISATNRIGGRAVQTDANTSPANYGGPLLDIEGRVIGICVPLHPESSETGSGVEWYDSGIGFAIPLDGAENLLAALKTGQTIRPARLGVRIRPSKQQTGVGVARVQAGSPAAKAGLKTGDVILAVDDEKLRSATHLKSIISRHVEGDSLKLRIQRNGKQNIVEVTFTAFEKSKLPLR